MGLMDHKASWEFIVAASPEDCVAAFTRAISSKKGLMASKWKVQRMNNGAIASYEGRGGLMGVMTDLSDRASTEQAVAQGSRVVFDVAQGEDGRTVCHMHLGEWGRQLVLTSDARFIRPAMQNVEVTLRQLDPSLVVRKV